MLIAVDTNARHRVEAAQAVDDPPGYALPVRMGSTETEVAGGFRYYHVEQRVDDQWVGASLEVGVFPDNALPVG